MIESTTFRQGAKSSSISGHVISSFSLSRFTISPFSQRPSLTGTSYDHHPSTVWDLRAHVVHLQCAMVTVPVGFHISNCFPVPPSVTVQ